MITNDARCAREIKFRIATAKATVNNKVTSNWTYIEERNFRSAPFGT
jgi:hypothetical protein